MARRITQSRTYSRIKLYSTIFLYSKKGQISTISIRLQEVELAHDKRQNATTIDWKSNQQTQKCKILQQTRSYLEIQQYMN